MARARKRLPIDAASGKVTGKSTQVLTFPASQLKQSANTLYLMKAPASVLFSVLSINRRIQEKDEGYQRVLSVARVEAITRFVTQGKALPGAIIVSFDSATFKDGKLTLPKGTDIGWVIDGQHRLAGAALAARATSGPDIECRL